jgi:hypothetical protein
MTVGTDRMHRMLVEVARGVSPDETVLAPLTAEERDLWVTFEGNLRDMQRRGRTLYIPNEWPDLDGYVKGEVPGIEHVP